MRALFAAAVAAGALFVAATPASAAPHLTDLGALDGGMFVTTPPGDTQRLFVVEREGRVRLFRDGVDTGTPFLSITGDVDDTAGEKGMLSMAFAPDYATSRRFYVYYTAHRSGDSGGSVIAVDEFQASASNPDAADTSTRRRVLSVDHPTNPNHNGGQLQFGPGGLLYAATGDGGSNVVDVSGNAQNVGSRLGKILRADAGAASPVWEQYARGLRNPWRFSFDRATGDLIVADVGESSFEEISFTPAGQGAGVNYGWNCLEGNMLTGKCPAPGGDTRPVVTKNHSSDGFCAIVGGYVVRDPALAPLTGRYVYGDNCKDEIRSVSLPSGSGDAATGMAVNGLTSFGEDSCGHVYAVSFGRLYRIDGDTFTSCSAGGSGGGGGGGPATAPDTRLPALRLTGARYQRVLRSRAFLVGGGCDELCTITARGTFKLQGARRAYRLRRATKSAAAGVRTKLYLTVAPTGLRAIRTALRKRRRVRADIVVSAKDPAGNVRRVRRTIRARR